MLHNNIKFELFVELSNEQQQTINGGGPTLGSVSNLAKYILRSLPVYSAVYAGPQGAGAIGYAIPKEIDSLANQIALSATDIANLAS
jgi:hypothetical protein